MATTTPNYGWDVPTSTDYVADGAVAIETLGDDIDASLFSITGGKNVGLVHLSSTTFTSQSSVSFNNVFNSTYENYYVKFNLSGQTNNGGAIYLRLRNSGSDIATSNYDNKILGIDASANNFTGVFNYYYLGAMAADMGSSEVSFYKPSVAVNSRTLSHTSMGYNGNQIYYTGGCRFTSGTAADGFTILPASGSFSGTIRVYGLRNS